MENCIFCKIVKGEIPAHKVYEDENFLAFLSIDPREAGHVQVIPKEHYRWVWDLPSEALAKEGEPNIGEYFEVVQKIAKAQQKSFGVEMIRSQVYGEEVPHAHVWLWPGEPTGEDPKDFEGNAEKIKRALK